jgi:hypothetical protein
MSRKQELERAYEALDTSLRTVFALEERGNPGGKSSYMLTDYVVIAAMQGIDDDGDPCTGITFALPHDSEMPIYRILGLVDFFRQRIRKMVTGDGG